MLSRNPVSSNQGDTRRPIRHREQKPVHISRNFETDRHEHAPYIQVKLIETAVARYYQHVSFTHEFIDAMEQELERTIQELSASDQLAKEQSERQAAKLNV